MGNERKEGKGDWMTRMRSSLTERAVKKELKESLLSENDEVVTPVSSGAAERVVAPVAAKPVPDELKGKVGEFDTVTKGKFDAKFAEQQKKQRQSSPTGSTGTWFGFNKKPSQDGTDLEKPIVGEEHKPTR